MAVKAIALDDDNVQHLIIGLNRENIESLLRGDVFRLPRGIVPELTADSDIVLLFAETDDDLGKRFPPRRDRWADHRSLRVKSYAARIICFDRSRMDV